MHFLVTGGAGFIGSHVVEQLLSEGHWVTVVDNLSTGRAQHLPTDSRLTFLYKNLLDCTHKDFQQPLHGMAHLAATPSVIQSWQEPLASHQNNLTTTLAAIQLCQALQIPRFVYASSAAVYGNPVDSPVAETHPTAPISPYGLQKLTSEHYAKLLGQHSQFSCVLLRLFNVFGPRQRLDSPYSGVISIFQNQMQKGLPINLYGDGNQTRDFIYVTDVAVAFSKALQRSFPTKGNYTCNIATGNSFSLRELIEALKSCNLNWPAQINFLAARNGDIKHSQASTLQATILLDFQPQLSFKEAIKRYINNLRSNG